MTRLGWRDKLPRYLTFNDDDVTGTYLYNVLCRTPPVYKPPRFIDKDVDCDEVYRDIYIGDWATARNISYLKRIGVTHVLNAAEGQSFGMVNTGKDFYKGTGMKYLGLPLQDRPLEDISKYFFESANFIEDAVTSNGRVFVHCVMGVSRSSTCVCAYLMYKRNLTAAQALKTIRERRLIAPNEGFLEQLAHFDNTLRRTRNRNNQNNQTFRERVRDVFL